MFYHSKAAAGVLFIYKKYTIGMTLLTLHINFYNCTSELLSRSAVT
uniref:Uncharacterized protein n=1 Tax=Anguilla anguilla TaxID=7936 RepID=A0A0E9QP09_ANGAN